MKNHYVLNWDDEALRQCIIAGPLDQSDARQALKQSIIKSLQDNGFADTEKAANDLYQAAETDGSLELPCGHLSLSDDGASLLYGGGYEDRYEIVTYAPAKTWPIKKGDLVYRLDEDGNRKDDTPIRVCTDVTILCGTPVVWLEGHSACHDITMLEKASEE